MKLSQTRKYYVKETSNEEIRKRTKKRKKQITIGLDPLETELMKFIELIKVAWTYLIYDTCE